MTTLNIEGRRVTVSEAFLSLSPEEQERTVEEIAANLNVSPSKHPVMSQVNRGIAETAGGLVDLINPFDKQTGSAVDGITSLMEAGGVEVASGDPDGFGEGFARGVGQGAGGVIPAAKGLQVLQQAPGMMGRVASHLYPQAATKSGVATEALAAGVGRGTSESLEDAGAPGWVQTTAEIATPAVALPAVGAAARGTVAVGKKAPGVSLATRAAREVKRGVAPMTQQGAEEVAAERLRTLVGGEERAAALGKQISASDDLGLTPAQQTGDPNLLALEAQTTRENPLIRESLDAHRAASRTKAQDLLTSEGDVGDARAFFAERLDAFRTSMEARADAAILRARAGLEATDARLPETENSARVVATIKAELDTALLQERALWADIPRDATVGTENAKTAAQRISETAAFAQREDIPKAVRDLLTAETYGDTATVNDMHGAYSKLRQVARSAMAGSNQNKNTARIANEVAEAILKDLGAVDGSSELGTQINAARAYSRALHETFDQGTVGKILNRSIDGDESMDPAVALARTVGRGGSTAKVSARDIEAAAPNSRSGIEDFLRGKFASTAFAADGTFTPKRAREWLRNNQELMAEYPGLRQELAQAVANGDTAARFAARADARLKLADKSATATFNKGQNGKAVLSIIAADNPAQTARALVRTARKDKSGKALAGLKAAFADYLIDGATRDGLLTGKKLTALLSDKKLKPALSKVFDAPELGRMRRIAIQLSKLDAKPSADLGAVLDSPANKMIEIVVRIAAAKHGGAMGGGTMGGSIQTANIVSERARNMLRNLTNDRARQVLMDAIEDPELFKTLLRTPKAVSLSEPAQSRLAPYLIGAASLTGDDE